MKTMIKTMLLLVMVLMAQHSFAESSSQVAGVVNINTATKADLVLIPGIGEAKADAILAQRTQRPFTSKEDLLVIKGIGDKILEKISPYVVLQGETTIRKEKMDTKNTQS